MTTIKRFLPICLAAVLTSSCSDFLKDDSGDLLIPEKVDEYASMLYGEGYPNNYTKDTEWMQLMSDDVEVERNAKIPCDNWSGDDDVYLPVGRGPFGWALDIEYYVTEYSKAYDHAYANIMACNTVLENISTMAGDETTINTLAAQAHMLRAYAYFCLVNWYGEPYNESTADTDKGVIIRLASKVERDYPPRSSVAEVYRLINSDLDAALEYYDKGNKIKNIYMASKRAALLLKSRVALYQGKWDAVLETAGQLSGDDFSLFDISAKKDTELTHGSPYNFNIITPDNPETIWMFGGTAVLYNTYLSNGYNTTGACLATSHNVTGNLVSLYGDGDMRRYAFFISSEGTPYDYRYIPYKYYTFDQYTQAFRTSEALLNMAEAYAQKGELAEALDLITLLQKKRVKRSRRKTYKPEDFGNSEEAVLAFVREERRRELCFEEVHRWWDLRRYGCPELKHTFYSSQNASPEVFTLKQGDRNYTLELPKSELDYNTNAKPIDRRVVEAE